MLASGIARNVGTRLSMNAGALGTAEFPRPLDAFDTALGIRAHKRDCAAHRDVRAGLGASVVECVREGTIRRFMERRAKFAGQNEVLRMLEPEAHATLESRRTRVGGGCDERACDVAPSEPAARESFSP